jgi:hypothetical protein
MAGKSGNVGPQSVGVPIQWLREVGSTREIAKVAEEMFGSPKTRTVSRDQFLVAGLVAERTGRESREGRDLAVGTYDDLLEVSDIPAATAWDAVKAGIDRRDAEAAEAEQKAANPAGMPETWGGGALWYVTDPSDAR